VIAQGKYTTPRALDGQLIGVTGDPSDLAVLRSVVAGGGGRPSSLRTITIGYNAVADLESGRVAAATAFWNDEGVTLNHSGRHFTIFRVENFGAPPYPELVVCATSSFLRGHAALARDLVHALVHGYETVLADPKAGAAALESQVTGLSPSEVSEQLAGELPAFTAPNGRVGALDPATLDAWATWEARFGIVKRRPDVRAMFTSAYLPST
jgi:putative hydroxymethylpyrimidine transport system substrate-binding protein